MALRITGLIRGGGDYAALVQFRLWPVSGRRAAHGRRGSVVGTGGVCDLAAPVSTEQMLLR